MYYLRTYAKRSRVHVACPCNFVPCLTHCATLKFDTESMATNVCACSCSGSCTHKHKCMPTYVCPYICVYVSSLCNALSPIFNCRIVLPTHRRAWNCTVLKLPFTRRRLLSVCLLLGLRCSLLILVINWRWCRTSCAGLLKGLQDVNARGNSINANYISICGLSGGRGTRNKIYYERLSKYPTHTHEYMYVCTYNCVQTGSLAQW